MRLNLIRAGLLATGTAIAALGSALPAAAQDAAGNGRAKVLVVPIAEQNGVKRDFGRKVSEEVRDRLMDLGTLEAISENAVEDELKRLKLDEDDLGVVQWRQLAGRLDADLLLTGTVRRASGGNAFNVSFIDARSGDETQIPEFVVQDDGGRGEEEAADQIMAGVEGQVEYQRSVLFCSDYLSSEEYEDALRNCNQALEYNPNSVTAKYLRGRIYMATENWEAAKADLDDVLAANPAEVDAINSLAYTEMQLGNRARAMELYREYLGFNPDDPAVRMQIAYEQANAGFYDDAIALLEEGVARDSTNADMWKFLGDVRLNKGTASSDTTMMPEGTPPVEGTATTAEQDEAIRGAVDAYEKVLELKGAEADPQMLRNVVAAYLQMGDLDAATDFAERAEQQLPEDAQLRSIKADIRARAEDWQGAVAAMDEALRLNPDLPRGLTKRGFFKLSAGDEAGAMADLRAAVQGGEDPEVVAQQLLSRGYNDFYRSGDYARAVELFDVALEFAQPGSTQEQLYFFKAASHYQLGAQLDTSNEAEACGPARQALTQFERVLPNLNRAGSQQPEIQAQLRESTDVYLYRQQAILNKPACRG